MEKAVVLPKKIAEQIKLAEKNMKSKQYILASALFNIKAKKINLNEKQVRLIVDAVYYGYTIK